MESQNLPIVGIGPVIAGHSDRQPVYFVDLLLADGVVSRRIWPKAARRTDRPAKLAAIRERIRLAEQFRPHVVLAHDRASFDGLVWWFGRAATAH
jgi:hypothetical protein